MLPENGFGTEATINMVKYLSPGLFTLLPAVTISVGFLVTHLFLQEHWTGLQGSQSSVTKADNGCGTERPENKTSDSDRTRLKVTELEAQASPGAAQSCLPQAQHPHGFSQIDCFSVSSDQALAGAFSSCHRH